MAITGIGHIAITVSDMKKSLDFYCNVLGFKKVFDIPDEQGRPWIEYLSLGNGQFVELFHPAGEAPLDGVKRVSVNHLCFLVDDIQTTAADIQKRGGALDRPIKTGRDGNFQCWVKDPDGTRIEMMQIVAGSPHAKYMR
jgi:catechol 2,3-dioxygenase-like lactoylglutathione lyase family enzyme